MTSLASIRNAEEFLGQPFCCEEDLTDEIDDLLAELDEGERLALHADEELVQ